MAYVAKNGAPWHKLGTGVSDDMTPEEIGKEAQLNWLLEKGNIYNDRGEVIPHRYELRRSTDKRPFDIVTDLYKPLQPHRALEFFKKFVEAGRMKMETAGSLEGGRRIFVTAKLNEGFTLKGGDRVEGYLFLTSPNFAGECAMAKFTGVRIVCWNTHRLALADKGAAVKINHLNEFDEKAQKKAQEALGMAIEATHAFGEQAKELSNVKANDQQVLRYIHQLTGGKVLEAIVEGGDAHAKTGKSVLDAVLGEADFAHQARDVRPEDLGRVGKSILEAITNSPGSDLASAKGTWWGAFNGVTYVADNVSTLKSQSLDQRYSSAWFGDKAALKNKAFDLALQYAHVN